MKSSLLFSLNATAPVFLMMVLGMVLRRIGWLDRALAAKLNTFVFKVPLPLLVFEDLAMVDLGQAWDTKFVLFCFGVTALSIVVAWGLSLCWRECSIRGEFIQASYRSSAALLGTALIQNIYGTTGMAPFMIIGSVPLYNIAAVVVLSLLGPGRHGLDREAVKSTVRGIVTNPILIGIAAGILWAALRLPMPVVLQKTVSSVAGTATPLGLMAMGATFDFRKAASAAKAALTATALKLVGFCAMFTPLAVALGFRDQALVAIVIMLGSATTVSSYVMAKNMGHDGSLTASTVMLTTLFSAFTITAWLWLLRSLSLI